MNNSMNMNMYDGVCTADSNIFMQKAKEKQQFYMAMALF